MHPLREAPRSNRGPSLDIFFTHKQDNLEITTRGLRSREQITSTPARAYFNVQFWSESLCEYYSPHRLSLTSIAVKELFKQATCKGGETLLVVNSTF